MSDVYAVIGTLLIFASVTTGAMWLGPAWDELTSKFIGNLKPRLMALNIDEEWVMTVMRWWGIGLCSVLLFVGVIWGKLIIAIGVLLFLISMPRFMLDQLIEKRRIKLRDQLVAASIGLANTTRAGLTLAQGFENIAPDIPEPLGTEFRRIVRSYQSGQPLSQAIREVKGRMDLEAFNVFSSAVLVALEQGGQISKGLDKISSGLAELQRLERKIESSSAGGRRLAMVLGMFPPGFIVGFYVLDPASVGLLFDTMIGQIILLLIGFMVFISIRWCISILDIDV